MRSILVNRQGLTLPEVLAALALLSVGIVAFASVIPVASASLREGGQLTTATFLANQRLEQLRGARWMAVPDVDELGLSPAADLPPATAAGVGFPDEDPLPGPYAEFSRNVRVSDCATPGACGGVQTADLRQITVTVRYRPSFGTGGIAGRATKAAVLTLYVSKR